MAPGLISEQIRIDNSAPMFLYESRDSEMVQTNSAGGDEVHNPSLERSSQKPGHQANALTPPLSPTERNEMNDLVCIGFGPAGLGIAVALNDMYGSDTTGNAGSETTIRQRVRFLEKQSNFSWHPGMLLPGAKMQISFIKDLATLRDPRSYFTFLNYLKEEQRLVQFTNLSTFLPSRLEFERYMRWAANHFESSVDYSEEVTSVRPIRYVTGQKYDRLEIESRNCRTGHTSKRISKNVVIAVGGYQSRPAIFQKHNHRILHTSEYLTKIVAVVGSGQSAAEVFNDLHTRYPNASTRLIMRDTALRPSDDSPFVNEVFDPSAVDTFYHADRHQRDEAIKKNRATNYSVVRLPLLEHIYESMYTQSIEEPDRSKWQHQILPSRDVVGVSEEGADQKISLALRRLDSGDGKNEENASFDAVILATGYKRDQHIAMLEACQEINSSKDGSWTPNRDYSLGLDRSMVEADVGIWLQGANESSHGLADSLLSIIATRSGELVQSIFGNGKR
ncbi:L-ornithine N(5)-monooxygenase [Cyphellophora attinorum]|uniref:L-ornithine N(5)-monooxygenase n=1 Tax=Cyphellophora attinorum TaxID=1664694 RepID=A0A0N1H4H8_9EURO|nr:L-ornithine N(5)-monooxygenase [Phialophora attinorum]KPI36176.1 L-ornithine N(5)-monooxygenase [Phialophora attinorum]